MSISKTQWVIIGGILLLAVFGLLLFTGIIPGLKQRAQMEVTLTLWGLDDRNVWNEIIALYEKARPGVRVRYEQLSPDNYEKQLIDGLAGTSGPDVFMFQHNWLPKHYNKIAPAEESIIHLSQLRTLFPTAVEQDFAPDGVVFALPLDLDTLSLFYNKDLFDNAGIARPPTTWSQFEETAKKLGFGKTAIGGSLKNIDRAPDILNLLILQSGISPSQIAHGGLGPLNFYTKFSNPQSDYYVWDEKQPFSIESFARGELGMMFGYHYHTRFLKEVNPFLNFGVVSVPQSTTKTAINYPFYYGLAVAANTPYYGRAWDFVLYATTNLDAVSAYLKSTNTLPALRSLIEQTGYTPALTARSWLQPDNIAVDHVLSAMIEAVVAGADPDRALREAEAAIYVQ